jgi:YVTN family beta-propeller protein
VDERSIASEGSVSVIDLSKVKPPNYLTRPSATLSLWMAEARREDEIVTGLRAGALALSPNGKFLVVANAGSDTVSVVDTRRNNIVETICARQNPADLFGAQANALAFDKSGKRLFVCNGTQNAVAVFQFKPGTSKLLGLIPVGWFPGAIAFDARDKQLCVANLKEIAVKMQKPKSGLGNGAGFNTLEYSGSLSLVPVRRKRNW